MSLKRKKRKDSSTMDDVISSNCTGFCMNCENKNPDGLFIKKVHTENKQDVEYIYPLCEECYYMNLRCDCCKKDFSFEKIQTNEHKKIKKHANIYQQKIIDGIIYKFVKNINNGFASIKFTCNDCNKKNKFNFFGRISTGDQSSTPQMNNIENIRNIFPNAKEHVKFSESRTGFSHKGETKYLNLIRVIISHHNLNGETLVWEMPSRFARMKWKYARMQLIDIINEFEVRIIFYSVVDEKNNQTKTVVLKTANDVDVYSNILEPAFNKAYDYSKKKGKELADIRSCRSNTANAVDIKFCRSFYDKTTISQPIVNHPNKKMKLNNNGEDCKTLREDCKAFREDFINRDPDEICNICNKYIADHKSKNTGIFSSFSNMFKGN